MIGMVHSAILKVDSLSFQTTRPPCAVWMGEIMQPEVPTVDAEKDYIFQTI